MNLRNRLSHYNIRIALGFLVISTLIVFFSHPAFAHAQQQIEYSNFEETISGYSIQAVTIATVLLVILAAISLLLKSPSNIVKKILFFALSSTIVVTTLFLSASTIYLNSISASKGPVHWHADFEIYSCGEEVELRNPKGLSNKIGTPVLHEHNDKRVHLEGVVVVDNDASLGKFFHVIDGEIANDHLSVPLENEKQLTKTNGELCPDGQEGKVQVFVYRVNEETGEYTQTKLQDPAKHIIAPHSEVPPGDCVIIEFGPEKEKTDNLCRSFRVAQQLGNIKPAQN